MKEEETDINENPDDEDEDRECENSCSHYDELNKYCWQVTERGLCFHVCEGDLCHLGYKRSDQH